MIITRRTAFSCEHEGKPEDAAGSPFAVRAVSPDHAAIRCTAHTRPPDEALSRGPLANIGVGVGSVPRAAIVLPTRVAPARSNPCTGIVLLAGL